MTALIWIAVFALVAGIVTIAGMVALSAPTNPKPVATLQSAASVLVKTLGDLPKVQYVTVRDGTPIAYRAYAGASERVAVLVHGSSGSSVIMHILAKELAKNGIATYALDMRGHGFSGLKGDIAYIGQLEDDVEDFLKAIAAKHPNAKKIMIGFSSGGGFALRFAGGPKNEQFDGYVGMSPYVGFDAPSTRLDNAGGWVSAAVPRIIALGILQRLGIAQFGYLPVLGFAIPEDQRKNPMITSFYSYRLWANFGPMRDWQTTIRNIRRPLVVIAGELDELMYADKFDASFRLVRSDIPVELVPNINHMQLATEPPAIAAIATAVNTLLPAQ